MYVQFHVSPPWFPPSPPPQSDLESKRAVPTETAKEYATQVGIEFLETSAKNSSNVEAAFTTMAAQIKTRMKSAPAEKRNAGPTVGQGQKLGGNKQGCC